MEQDANQKRAAFAWPPVDMMAILKSLGLVAITTLGLMILDYFFALRHVTLVYLVPVVIAATKLGIVPAVVAAIACVGGSAFFFYAPIYSFMVDDPQHLIELPLFIFVAIVTGQLATSLRRQAEVARRREKEVQELYSFSRRLAEAHTEHDIYTAIREHLASMTGRPTFLLEVAPNGSIATSLPAGATIPDRVRSETEALARGVAGERAGNVIDDSEGHAWIIRRISERPGNFAGLAIDLGSQVGHATDLIQQPVEAVLADATATLKHLDLDQAISDARLRSETEALRDALIGSVSHQLRTPLVSILGAATVISQAPGNKSDARLESLATVLRSEVERLNNDVQDLLDAAMISSEGVRLDAEWVEPTDIVNTAVDRRQRLLAKHRVVLQVADELPLIYVDPILLEQAFGQVLDNAAKYSPQDSKITIAANVDHDHLLLSVADQGIGLVGDERTRLWERFFRGERHASNVTGSGLGLWIAKAFVTANGGTINAFSEGADRGTVLSIRLPVRVHDRASDGDE
jgi:two-component system sensor histidine kinase KdpD